MENFYGFFMEKYHEYGMKISWKKHENPLNIQRFMAHEKTLTNKKKTMKMPWNKMKPSIFFSRLCYDNEKAMNGKAIFHGVRIYGVFMGVFKFMPQSAKSAVCILTWLHFSMVYHSVNEAINDKKSVIATQNSSGIHVHTSSTVSPFQSAIMMFQISPLKMNNKLQGLLPSYLHAVWTSFNEMKKAHFQGQYRCLF